MFTLACMQVFSTSVSGYRVIITVASFLTLTSTPDCGMPFFLYNTINRVRILNGNLNSAHKR